MTRNKNKYHFKSGLIGGLIGGLDTYIFIYILNLFDNYIQSYNNLVPLISLIPIILIIIDVNTFKKMVFGYSMYILGYVISLFILMDVGIISIFWGWIYVVTSIIIILYKIGFLKVIWELIKGVKNARY